MKQSSERCLKVQVRQTTEARISHHIKYQVKQNNGSNIGYLVKELTQAE